MVSGVFLVTVLLMVMAPGPSFMLLVNQTAQLGRRAGLITVAGSSSGLLFWAVASVLGLSVLLRTSEVAFAVFKLAGAGYLCWLGISSFRKARMGKPVGEPARPERSVQPAADRPRAGLWEPYRAGVIVSMANPKMAAVYLALFPQFLPVGGGTLGDVALLASVQIAISASWYLLVVLAIERARRYLCRPTWSAWLNRISGTVLISLGLRTATLPRSTLQDVTTNAMSATQRWGS